MRELFDRICILNISDKVFKYDLKLNERTQIEFNIEFNLGMISNSATVKIYNINDETIELARPKKTKTDLGIKTEYKFLTLEAGYREYFGIVLAGEIYDTKVNKSGVDRILELKVGGNLSKFGNFPINKTYNNKSTKFIVEDILKMSGFASGGNIEVEKDVKYNSIVINDLRQSLKRLAMDSDSDFYINNNQIFFKKKLGLNERVLLDYDSGLIEEPEKTDLGYVVKSLFNYQIQIGNLLVVKGKTKEYFLKVVKGKHDFSVSGQSITEFEGQLIK